MNKLQSNSMSHKFNDNINGVNVVSKLSDANNIMMFLNFIHQNDKKIFKIKLLLRRIN
jgi:hypothetical protein